MKKSRTDAVRSALSSYLERRNYPDVDVLSHTSNLCQSAEQMAVSTIVQSEASRPNSILFSCINNDPAQCENQYARLVNFIKEVEWEWIRGELLGLLRPLLCHLYLEMLRGGHSSSAQLFLKRHSASLPQKDLQYHQPVDGNLPSALYRPNSLEQLFNSLQNGTIDNDTPEKDYMNQILDDLGSIYTLQDIEVRPLLAAFRSCKFDLPLTQDALNVLKKYLAKHGHVLLMQVLQTWFHIEVANEPNSKAKTEDEEQLENEFLDIKPNLNDIKPDEFSKCNGHVDYRGYDKELRELQECIRSVRDTAPPLKLYEISSPDSNLICGKTDSNCNLLCGGFGNSELRIWNIGRNQFKKKVNGNISKIELACNILPDPEETTDDFSATREGVVLRGHSGPVQACAFLEAEGLVLSCSHDNTMRAWRLSDYSCAAIYRGHNYPIWCMDVWNGGVYIVTGSHDRTAKLWTLDRTFPLRIFTAHIMDITCVQFHPNGAYLATGSADKCVRMWCIGTGNVVRLMPGHRAPVHALAFSPDGRYLASAGEDKKIKIWDLASGNSVHEYRGHHARVTALHWSSLGAGSPARSTLDPAPSLCENAALCSTGMDATVKIWDCQPKNRSVSSQDVLTSTYNTPCSYVVNVQSHANWVAAIGAKR